MNFILLFFSLFNDHFHDFFFVFNKLCLTTMIRLKHCYLSRNFEFSDLNLLKLDFYLLNIFKQNHLKIGFLSFQSTQKTN